MAASTGPNSPDDSSACSSRQMRSPSTPGTAAEVDLLQPPQASREHRDKSHPQAIGQGIAPDASTRWGGYGGSGTHRQRQVIRRGNQVRRLRPYPIEVGERGTEADSDVEFRRFYSAVQAATPFTSQRENVPRPRQCPRCNAPSRHTPPPHSPPVSPRVHGILPGRPAPLGGMPAIEHRHVVV